MMIEQTDANGGEPEVQSQLLGEFLKEKRLAKNYTIEKISQKTKINLNILRALENNDYKNLPSAAYIKGFVTSYSKTLGLDLNEVYSKMEYTYYQILGKSFPFLNHTHNFKPTTMPSMSSMPTSGTAKNSKIAEETPHEVIENSKNVIETSKSLLPFAIFAGVLIAIIGGYQVISSVINTEVDAQKQQDLGPTFAPSSELLKDKQVPATAATSETAPQKELKAEEKAAAEKLVEKPAQERSFPQVSFKKIKSRLFTTVPDAPENSDEAIIPASIKTSMNPEIQNIYIRATDGSTWMSYKIDEKPIESVIIEQGKDLLIQGNEVRLFLGNVRVTKIFYNNTLINAETKSGVKSLIFPESSNSKFMLPLFPKGKDDILYTTEDYTKRMKLEEDQLNKTE